MNYFSVKNKKGFTLVETLVAITMLTITIASTMGLVQASLASNSYSQQQITANYLAGEAIEYIRNIRDTNIRNNNSWLTNIPLSCFDEAGCAIDTVNQSISACVSTCNTLLLDTSSSGYYQYQSGDESSFRRTVNIETITPGVEIEVRVRIDGQTGLFSKTPMVVVEQMYNW